MQWSEIRLLVLNRDGWRCAYCGCELRAGENAQVDHLNPRHNGGGDDLWNLVAACDKCNRRKSDRIIERLPWRNPRFFGQARPASPPPSVLTERGQNV